MRYKITSFNFDGRPGQVYEFNNLEQAIGFAETYFLAYSVREDDKEVPVETVEAVKNKLKL